MSRTAHVATGTELEASIMRMLLGIIAGAVVGIVLMWLYRSERVRDEAQRRLSTAPESLRQAATSAKAVSAGQIERVTQAVDAASVYQPLRDTLVRATVAARSTAGKLGGTALADRNGTPSDQETPDA